MSIARPLRRLMLGLCCLALAGAALQGCRNEEQGRVLQYQKGTYLGTADRKLSDAEVNSLRTRVSAQSGS